MARGQGLHLCRSLFVAFLTRSKETSWAEHWIPSQCFLVRGPLLFLASLVTLIVSVMPSYKLPCAFVAHHSGHLGLVVPGECTAWLHSSHSGLPAARHGHLHPQRKSSCLLRPGWVVRGSHQMPRSGIPIRQVLDELLVGLELSQPVSARPSCRPGSCAWLAGPENLRHEAAVLLHSPRRQFECCGLFSPRLPTRRSRHMERAAAPPPSSS